VSRSASIRVMFAATAAIRCVGEGQCIRTGGAKGTEVLTCPD
jgi:hypothetical protein